MLICDICFYILQNLNCNFLHTNTKFYRNEIQQKIPHTNADLINNPTIHYRNRFILTTVNGINYHAVKM